jgi:predicted nucleic acid-binding protein
MNGRIHGRVVDASVGIHLFINSPFSDAAHELFTQQSDQPSASLYVPDLFYIEVANVLWKYVRWQGLRAEQAQDYLQQLGQLVLHSTSTADLMGDALTEATAYNITAYDACYLALAQQLAVPLITADAKFVKAINDPERIQLLK